MASILLGLFIIFDLWWMILGFSIWLTWFPPKGITLRLLVLLAAALAASWRFQVVRPWDFYHEGDGSRPGWEPVQMASLTTVISFVSAMVSVALSSFIVRRSVTART